MTGDTSGSSDRRDTSYQRWWNGDRRDIPEWNSDKEGGILHTGNRGSSDRILHLGDVGRCLEMDDDNYDVWT